MTRFKTTAAIVGSIVGLGLIGAGLVSLAKHRQVLNSRENALTNARQKLDALQASLDRREASITAADEELARREAKLTKGESDLADLEIKLRADADAREEKLSQREEQLRVDKSALEDSLARNRHSVNQTSNELKEREHDLADRERELSQRVIEFEDFRHEVARNYERQAAERANPPDTQTVVGSPFGTMPSPETDGASVNIMDVRTGRTKQVIQQGNQIQVIGTRGPEGTYIISP